MKLRFENFVGADKRRKKRSTRCSRQRENVRNVALHSFRRRTTTNTALTDAGRSIENNGGKRKMRRCDSTFTRRSGEVLRCENNAGHDSVHYNGDVWWPIKKAFRSNNGRHTRSGHRSCGGYCSYSEATNREHLRRRNHVRCVRVEFHS